MRQTVLTAWDTKHVQYCTNPHGQNMCVGKYSAAEKQTNV